MELTVLKVKIGLRQNGQADHPNFNTLAVVSASGMDWSKYVDVEGTGWNYDKVSGHNDDEVGSPRGQQWACLFVPDLFAQQAVAAFPLLCTIIDEAEATDFYENRSVKHLPAERVDQKAIQNLRDKMALMREAGATQTQIDKMKTKMKNAINPDHDEPGITKNWRKKFTDMKGRHGITIKPVI